MVVEAAIPQIIESSIYECYKDYGWNISNNKNKKYNTDYINQINAIVKY